jgi:EAL domain-containing protein (putative c-di-GMP-specific phosphodiesterase class I)
MLDLLNPTTDTPYGAERQLGECAISQVTLRQKLERRRVQLEQVLAEVNEGIATLDANPDLERFIGVMNKTGVRM